MALSTKTERALELANHALSMLYATDYFTEDEWIQIDALMHKGKYVWTQGPPACDLLDGSPLLVSSSQRAGHNGTQAINLGTSTTLPTPPESRFRDTGSPLGGPNYNDSPLVDFSAAETSELSQSSLSRSAFPSTSSKKPDPLTKANLNTIPQAPKTTPRERPNINELKEEYMRRNGRAPKSIADVWQPNNPGHWSNRWFPKPESHASSAVAVVTTAPPTRPKSTTVSKSVKTGPDPPLKVEMGRLLVAQKTVEVSHNKGPKISILKGDTFKYIKHVSGPMHYGLNLRTNKIGQVNEDVFKNSNGHYTEAVAPVQRPATKRIRQASMTSVDLREGIDNMVEMNAAEWNEQSDDDDESVASQLTKVATSSNVFPEERVVDWAEEMNAIMEAPQEEQQEVVKTEDYNDSKLEEREAVIRGVSEVFEEKFQKYMNGRDENTNGNTNGALPVPPVEKPVSTSRTPWAKNANSDRGPLAEAVKPAKRQTCWFWLYKTCRFTAEECHDLHELSDAVPVLKKGRPTWGAATDVVTAEVPTSSAPLKSVGLLPPVSDPRGRRYICHFWANGHCTKSDDKCKYLHSNAGERIAFAPAIEKRMLQRTNKSLYSSWIDPGYEKAKDMKPWRDVSTVDSKKQTATATAAKNPFSLLDDEGDESTTEDLGTGVSSVGPESVEQTAPSSWDAGGAEEVPGYW